MTIYITLEAKRLDAYNANIKNKTIVSNFSTSVNYCNGGFSQFQDNKIKSMEIGIKSKIVANIVA